MCGPMDTLLQLRVDLFASCKELTKTNDYSRNKLLGNISSFRGVDTRETQQCRPLSVRSFLVFWMKEKKTIIISRKLFNPTCWQQQRAHIKPDVYCLLISESEEQQKCAVFYSQHANKDFIFRPNIYVLPQTYTRE
jgi:hypothetical protein